MSRQPNQNFSSAMHYNGEESNDSKVPGVPAPSCLLRQKRSTPLAVISGPSQCIVGRELLLMGAGPSNLSPVVCAALCQQPLLPMSQEMDDLMRDIKEGAKYVFQTRNPWTFAISGSGTAALETAICNLLEKGDRALVATHGFWGTRAVDMCQRRGVSVKEVHVPLGQVFGVKEIEEQVEQWRPKVVYICHGDSTVGVAQPLEEIGCMCRKYDCLLLVDAVASLGAVPIYMDRWHVDVLFSAVQKCLGGPPGLSLISFSDRAIKAINERKTPVDCFYLDAKLIGTYWGCNENGSQRAENGDVRRTEVTSSSTYHHTPPANLLAGLREALAIIATDRLEGSWKRHQVCGSIFAERVKKLGVEPVVADGKHRLPSLVLLKVPDGVSCDGVMDTLKQEDSIVIAKGFAGLHHHPVWRIGFMGFNATVHNVQLVLDAFEKALKQQGWQKTKPLRDEKS